MLIEGAAALAEVIASLRCASRLSIFSKLLRPGTVLEKVVDAV